MSYQTRKQLIESLILSKSKLLQHNLNQRINKLVQACLGFVKCKYGEVSVIADLNWLLVKEIIDFAMMKLAFAGLYKKNIHENLQLKAT